MTITIKVLSHEYFELQWARTLIHYWVKQVELEPFTVRIKEQEALDETVIKVNGQHYGCLPQSTQRTTVSCRLDCSVPNDCDNEDISPGIRTETRCR